MLLFFASWLLPTSEASVCISISTFREGNHNCKPTLPHVSAFTEFHIRGVKHAFLLLLVTTKLRKHNIQPPSNVNGVKNKKAASGSEAALKESGLFK